MVWEPPWPKGSSSITIWPQQPPCGVYNCRDGEAIAWWKEGTDAFKQLGRLTVTASLLCCSTAIGDVYVILQPQRHLCLPDGGEKHVLLSDLATMVHNWWCSFQGRVALYCSVAALQDEMFTKIGVFLGRIEGRLSRAALLLKILSLLASYALVLRHYFSSIF
jgi:hypothetical protein